LFFGLLAIGDRVRSFFMPTACADRLKSASRN